MCRQFRFDNKSQCRVFLAKPRKAADLKLECASVLASEVSLKDPELNTGMMHEASRCLQFFHSLDPTITQDSLAKIVTKTAESRITLQHHLAQILRGPQRDRVMSQFQEPPGVKAYKTIRLASG